MGTSTSWEAAKAVGAEAIEVDVDDHYKLPSLIGAGGAYSLADEAGIALLAKDLKASKTSISAFCLHSHFDQRPDFEVQFSTRLAPIARRLGVNVIRLDVASQKLTKEEFLEPAVAALKRLMEATEKTGVRFGVENHGRITNDPAFLIPLLDKVGSKRLGVTLDTGNFYWFGHPLKKVYELVELVAPRVVHTHCKSIRYEADQREVQRPMGLEYGKRLVPIDQGDIDYARVVKTLKAAGYTGALCVENEGLKKFAEAERVKVVAAEIALLKKVRG
jgi:sugar phosphate isomerase/epimerase